MQKNLQETLFKKYPKIFRQKDLSPKETCMCWGIDTGDGWFLLLDCLCALIQKHVDETGLPQVEAGQVKQKFGGLRFYIDGGDETINNVIRLFETLSYQVCELCGSTNNVKAGGSFWVQCTCQECKDKIEKEEKVNVE